MASWRPTPRRHWRQKKVSEPPAVAWNQWRGPNRDGRVDWLPDRLAPRPKIVWETRLSNQGLGGVAATDQVVIVSDRDAADGADVFRCLAASDGHELWMVRYPARGQLDYGNSPRATPVIDGDLVFLLGALGHLNCVSLDSGKVLWTKNLRQDFGPVKLQPWGYCSSPLIADGRLLVNPGAKDASLVALDRKTGELVWKTPGAAASFGSFILVQVAGRQQLVGHDQNSLGGWDPTSGERLWQLAPGAREISTCPRRCTWMARCWFRPRTTARGHFASTRRPEFGAKPLAENTDLCPDAHSPIVVGQRVFGISGGMHCLDLAAELKTLWTSDDEAFGEYASLIGSPSRVLVATVNGELLLIDAEASDFRLIDRVRLISDDSGVFSHPALVGTRLYVRGSRLGLVRRSGRASRERGRSGHGRELTAERHTLSPPARLGPPCAGHNQPEAIGQTRGRDNAIHGSGGLRRQDKSTRASHFEIEGRSCREPFHLGSLLRPVRRPSERLLLSHRSPLRH